MNFLKNYGVGIIFCSLFFACKSEPTLSLNESEKQITFNLPEDFILEDLYHASAQEQGSWVSLAQGPNNVMFACDQRGKIYEIKVPEEGKKIAAKDVKPLPLEIGEAHGLLYAFNSLYVAVNKRWDDETPDDKEHGSGVYRVTDTDNDGTLDHVEMLLKLQGEGEHGPHSLVLAPNGKEIYFIAGNHTLIPEKVKEKSRLPINWGEDNLYKPYLDARGHANDVKAPGGWISKFDADGTAWELISAGYRNPFDMAFNQDGELFTYDSDMEWDIGMPWYRPTRICHVTSGSEYGWRTGSGKWPDYYPDNLPGIKNMAQGSPTAVLSGAELNVPQHLKTGLFVMDWSFGTVYHIDLKPKGSSYVGEKKEFLSGVPLPLTDMIAGTDGNLYFATGGRGLDSHLYRLKYVGNMDSSDLVATEAPETVALRNLRKEIEQFHSTVSDKAISLAFNNLDHEDRFIRYASRVALEHQPVSNWLEVYQNTLNPIKIVQATIALAHQGDPSLKSTLITKLNSVDFKTSTDSQRIDLLRAYELIFIRMGNSTSGQHQAIVNQLKPYFPSENLGINRELSQLMQYLDAEGTTKTLVDLLEKYTKENTVRDNQLLSEEVTQRSEQYGPIIRDIVAHMPPSEAIFYGVLLSHANKGWNKELRESYFRWFYDVLGSKGGLSFKAGMENVRLQAMENVPKNEKTYFEEISGVYLPASNITNLPEPIGPGSNYSIRQLGDIIRREALNEYQGTFEAGQRAFNAAMCVACHRVKGEGGAIGPDLTQAHTKFSVYDMLLATYSPNDEISDQYAFTLLHTNDGKKLAGRILSEVGDSITLMPNPFNESYSVKLAKKEVVKRELSPVSPMPPALLNRLNEKEILDLFVFLQSGGDPNSEIYTKAKKSL